MWIDNLFRAKLENHSVQAPKNAWANIAAQLNERDRGVVVWMNIAEKRILAAGIVLASLFSMSLFQFIDNNSQVSNIQYAKVETSQATQLSEKILEQVSDKKVKSFVVQSDIRLPKPYRAFKKDIIEIVQLDKEIVKLAKQVERDDKQVFSSDPIQDIRSENVLVNTVIENTKESVASESKSIESKNELELTKQGKQELIADEVENEEEKAFRSKFYINPSIGTNFTQVSYNSTPNSPYFSENAKFTGNFGYNLGIQVGWQFTNKWSLESGASFGQYIQTFKENVTAGVERKGVMYIDQLDFPLMARYSIPFGGEEYPKSISFKAGLQYSSVLRYQVNYKDINSSSLATLKSVEDEADKRRYNSLQMGYIGGIDFDMFLSKRLSLNLSMLNSLVSQLENFPLFNSEVHRPLQFSTTFTIGTKVLF